MYLCYVPIIIPVKDIGLEKKIIIELCRKFIQFQLEQNKTMPSTTKKIGVSETTKKKYSGLTDHQQYLVRSLHQVCGLTVKEIMIRYKVELRNTSKTSVYRHAKIPLANPPKDRRIGNKKAGRKNKITNKDKHRIKRNITKLREERGSFTSVDLQKASGLEHMHSCTLRRALHSMGYKHRTTRRKGIVNQNDKKARKAFANKIRKDYGQDNPTSRQKDLWRAGVNTYTKLAFT